jgi:hypothetical protein
MKIVKLGMDTKEVIARFEQERQALAMMDHPHIAKVFDAGATQWGRPYFVMELVRGIKITDYCDQANLPTAERLALFIQVCNAVQHAHQKGIIHRDLKPSNILVTLHDGVPVPKVIDFGVAKATQQQRLSDLTIYTQFQQMIGTPLYMSPEQAEMSGLDIDTRTDIYSLGVLLYELLVGRTPFDPEALMRAGLDEIRRVIREQEPPKPSTALQTMAAEARAGVAQHRQADGAKMARLLSGELDWIVMKALEKDRARRYETANGFAEDIRRFLANEPVTAAAPSVTYLFRKFARRHKTVLGLAALIAVVLVAATAVSTWQAVRGYTLVSENGARSARAIARHRAARMETVLRRAQGIPEMMTLELESGALDTDEKLTAYIRAVLERNRGHVLGSCVAFAPHGFRESLIGYAPYYYWSKQGLQFEQLAKPGYNYFQWPWYRAPRDAGRPVWSEAYFDDGGGKTLMITYSVPVRRDGLFWAIITVNIELAQMLQDVSDVSGDEQETVGRSAYAFIINRDGSYLALPGQSPENVMDHRLTEKNELLSTAMLGGKEGVVRTTDPRDGKQAWVAYAPILVNSRVQEGGGVPMVEMSLAIVSPESPALDAARGLLVTQALIGLGWLTLLFVAIVVVARSISRPNRRRA